MTLSPTMLSYLRTIYRYTEGDSDPHTAWVTDHWWKTEVALTTRGLIEPNPHPRRPRDRQSVRLTDKGRQVLVEYESRETEVVTYKRSWGNRTGYRSIWKRED